MRFSFCWVLLCLPVLALGALPRSSLSDKRPGSSLLKDIKKFEVVPVTSDHFLQQVTKVTLLARDAPENATAPPPEVRMSWMSTLPRHPESTGFQAKAFGLDFPVRLVKSVGLFAPNYREEQQVWYKGRLISTTSKPLTPDRDCLYNGHVANSDDERSLAAVSTCYGGFRGVLVAHGETWNIDLAAHHLSDMEIHQHLTSMSLADANALHVMWRLADEKAVEWTCAVGDHDVSHAPHHVHLNAMDQQFGSTTSFKAQSTANSNSAEKAESPEKTAETAEHSHSHANDPLHLHRINDLLNSLNTKSSSSSSASSKEPKMKLMSTDQKVVELYVVNDNSRVKAFQERSKNPEVDSAEIVNLANSLYFKTVFANDIRVNVTLIGQASWITEDPYEIIPGQCSSDEGCKATEVSVNKLLSQWNAWRSNIGISHDCGHLFSSLDFAGPALGYAGVGVMCQRPQSGGIEQMGYSADNPAGSLALNGAVLAHEMGHNFDMKHDSQQNTCPPSGWIMNAVVDSSNAPTEFSSCAVNYFNNFMKDGLITCLDNLPTARWGDPVCGNGYVEPGEECDCPNNDCAVYDPCCFNCTLAKNLPGPNGPYDATCSRTDPCCDSTCNIVSASAALVCRAAKGTCDIEERCNGTTSKCPEDLAKGAGTGCSEDAYGTGACLNGQCLSLDWQCRTLGAGFSGGPYDACPAETQAFLNNGEYCQSMWCSSGPGSCTTFKVSTNIQLVYDGVPCASGKQCYHQQCVESEQLNPNFLWAKTDWDSCTDCDTLVYRNVTCRDRRDKTVLVEDRPLMDNAYCSPTSMPNPSQKCNNKTHNCFNFFSADGSTLDFFGYQIQKNTLMFGSLGGVSLFLVVLAICYQAVTWGGDELIKEREKEREKDKEHLDDIEHEKGELSER